MKVYRVHRPFLSMPLGDGPYRNYSGHPSCFSMALNSIPFATAKGIYFEHNDRTTHPGPYSGDKIIHDGTKPGWLFAFASLAQLRRWFDPVLRKAMASAGCKIAVIDAPSVVCSPVQCAFDPADATLIKVRELA